MRSSLTPPRPSGELERAQDYKVPQPSFPSRTSPQPQRPQARPVTHAAPSRLPVLAPAEGWLAMLLLAVAVYSVVISIISSGWVSANKNLLISTAVGLLLGLLVAKARRFPQIILHLGACLVGHWLSVFLTSSVAYHVSWLLLLQNLRTVISGGLVAPLANGGDMVFLFYLTFLCFFLGYFGAWLIYRAHLPWLVALIYCSIMLVNLQYDKADLSLLILVLVGALLLLIARIQLTNQLTRWSQEGLHTDRSWLRSITTRFMQVTALMTILILPLSLALPMLSQPTSGASLWNGIDNFWANITHGQLSINNPGSIFQPYQPATNFFGDQLSITGNVNLPTGQVLYYTSTGSSQAHYLEGFTYDYFDGHNWTAHAGSQNRALFPANFTLPIEVMGSSVAQATTSITMVNPPDGDHPYIFAPDFPNSFSVPTAIYGNGVTTAWTQQTPLSVGEHYQVISYIPTATPQELSAIPLPHDDPGTWTSDNYYPIISNYYLQTPDGLSPQVQATLSSWTRGAANTYDAMQMLVAHFTDQTKFAYSVSNPPVPGNIDAVSWLLQTHRGYCTYYATAMTVMARLLGVPARVVSGFNEGHYDAKRKVWEVDGNNAHSWVQVYFPGQGWIAFDPTPGFSLNNVNNPQPTATAGTSPTPVKPQPTTSAHPNPGKHPTPSSGSANGGAHMPGSSDGTHGMLFLGFSLLILLVALLALAVATYRYRLSKLYANIPIISVMYWRLSRLASLSGTAPRASQTPYEYTRLLAQRYPRAQAALWRITHLFVRERWGARQHLPRESEVKDLEQLWPSVRITMLRSWLSHFRPGRRDG
ncbi:MAG: transglutaminase TgpA family protein [Ktedonobacteraceae bacterium]